MLLASDTFRTLSRRPFKRRTQGSCIYCFLLGRYAVRRCRHRPLFHNISPFFLPIRLAREMKRLAKTKKKQQANDRAGYLLLIPIMLI